MRADGRQFHKSLPGARLRGLDTLKLRVRAEDCYFAPQARREHFLNELVTKAWRPLLRSQHSVVSRRERLACAIQCSSVLSSRVVRDDALHD
jgi:hypothetical protein